ncbi:hypothetical protein NX059_001798 [Plenodomus lindquistii]|nr:hypothetical protein NX059_001798 [Plenodomus lindquistii]
MPKVTKHNITSKDISVIYLDIPVTVTISKHFSPTDIYRTIHRTIHHGHSDHNIRITNAANQLLDLRYENLKTTAKIYAHRCETPSHGRAADTASAKKANKFVA